MTSFVLIDIVRLTKTNRIWGSLRSSNHIKPQRHRRTLCAHTPPHQSHHIVTTHTRLTAMLKARDHTCVSDITRCDLCVHSCVVVGGSCPVRFNTPPLTTEPRALTTRFFFFLNL